jgi:hypothetical protein
VIIINNPSGIVPQTPGSTAYQGARIAPQETQRAGAAPKAQAGAKAGNSQGPRAAQSTKCCLSPPPRRGIHYLNEGENCCGTVGSSSRTKGESPGRTATTKLPSPRSGRSCAASITATGARRPHVSKGGEMFRKGQPKKQGDALQKAVKRARNPARGKVKKMRKRQGW